MRLALQCHPDSECTAVQAIDVTVARPRAGALTLHYAVMGDIASLRLPLPAAAARRDGLWQHTCFEVFVRAREGVGYHEYNFAPSGEWAAYRFEDYREAMTNADMPFAPPIEARAERDHFTLLVELTDLPDDVIGKIGLSAVIEEANGAKSYWALAHPPGKADFHHPDCFALELPALERP